LNRTPVVGLHGGVYRGWNVKHFTSIWCAITASGGSTPG
jgi:hypothetical protein